MSRKPRVDRSPEEKWQIIQEGIKSGNVSETCRRHGFAPNLFYRWKDEAGARSQGIAWGEERCRSRNGKGRSHPTAGTNAGTEVAGDRNLKKRRGGVSCGAVHSHAREMVVQGHTARWWRRRWPSAGRVCTTESGREEAGRIELTTNRS